jgi:hypothetical protein
MRSKDINVFAEFPGFFKIKQIFSQTFYIAIRFSIRAENPHP